ncbi:HAD family hydrolase [Leptospira idonii]|uniref:HAD family hydrolase n=2 Tax=Leptospira idonii TaxID=1193500 RepID=A0A4R9LZY9_9LEPT|nr:HAD-IA family hydrolase [Leptospira idonii]TGN20014.1 HAD family hydrolase [Leptospira idonii]
MKLLHSKKNWIFDMDGTLTLAMHDFSSIKQELGLPGHLDILTGIGLLPKEEAEEKHKKLNAIELKIAKQAQASPGTHDLLRKIREGANQLGILTRNCFENAVETLHAADLIRYFSQETILCREHAEPKPSPEGIFKLLRIWNADPKETLMIGDYIYDLDAGKSAGVETVYIDPTGNFPFKEHATYSVKRLDEILSL